jgi:endonuclease G
VNLFIHQNFYFNLIDRYVPQEGERDGGTVGRWDGGNKSNHSLTASLPPLFKKPSGAKLLNSQTMKKGITIGGIIAVVLLLGAILFCAWIAPKINEKLSEINDPIPEKTTDPGKPSKPTNLPPVNQPKTDSEAERIYLALGNPSGARANLNFPDNYLLVNKYYVLSYNQNKAIPNWVAWQLTKEDMGVVDRQNDFRIDERLPKNWKNIFPSYYTRSGYNRGHIIPSADRTSSRDANSSTFLMTNMTPQTPDLNQGPWEKLERFSRSLARRNNDLYIYSGCYGEKTKLRRRITVPTNCWKVIVSVSRGGQIDSATRVIAVDMPNIKGIKEKNWRDYKTSVKAIEKKTGFDFLSVLPKNLQDNLEAKVD